MHTHVFVINPYIEASRFQSISYFQYGLLGTPLIADHHMFIVLSYSEFQA